MFSVLDDQNEKWNIPLVDFHTHIGKVKIETTKGSSLRVNRPQDILDLYEKLKFELHRRITENPDNFYVSVPSIDEFIVPMHKTIKNTLFNDDTKGKGWIVDHIVTFPFNDIFHLKTNPKFVKSNDYVRSQIQKFDFTFRFIPFCRVDPNDQNSDEEVKKASKLGMRGLKLHPLSQHWIDKIKSDETKHILKTASNEMFPIIFDVPNKGVAKDIFEISEESRFEAENEIKVVFGHNGFDYSSKEIFKYLDTNNMFTETSGMRGEDVKIFFKNVIEVNTWYKKILYGSDSNYFSVLQASDFISFLFTNEFKSLVENKGMDKHPLELVSQVLGLNALEIIPNFYTANKQQKDMKFQKLTQENFKSFSKNFTHNKENKIAIESSLKPDTDQLCELITFQTKNKKKSFILSTLDSNLLFKEIGPNFIRKLSPFKNTKINNGDKSINANDEKNINKFANSIEELLED